MDRKTDRLMTAAAKERLDSSAATALFAAAEASPRKDIVRIPNVGAYCKRDRHGKDHHVLTICVDGED